MTEADLAAVVVRHLEAEGRHLRLFPSVAAEQAVGGE